jgi:hypothetical protein
MQQGLRMAFEKAVVYTCAGSPVLEDDGRIGKVLVLVVQAVMVTEIGNTSRSERG